jgi:hypothetical protein
MNKISLRIIISGLLLCAVSTAWGNLPSFQSQGVIPIMATVTFSTSAVVSADLPRPGIVHVPLQRISPLATVVTATGTVSDTAGLSRIDAYYYRDSDTSISTATVYFSGYPAATNFSCSMTVFGMSSVKHFYYRFAAYDRNGYCGQWPANDNSFCQVNVDASYVSTVGLDGGTISIPGANSGAGNTCLQIPQGALDGSTQITITEVNPSDGSSLGQNALALSGQNHPVAIYQFGPDGLVFKEDVILTLAYRDANHDGIVDDTSFPASSLGIMWWDGRDWRLLGGTVDTRTNTVSCRIRHFSIYALFSAGPVTDADARPKEKIITPALADHINDFAQFGGLSDTDVVNIYDVTGRRIRQLRGNSIWDGRDDDNAIVESGLYIYQIKKSGKTISGTIVVAK